LFRPRGGGLPSPAPFGHFASYAKRQLIHRLPLRFVSKTLADFNAGTLSASAACAQLEVGKTRLYQLRADWLKKRSAFALDPSGGNHHQPWPQPVIAFLREFLPLQSPPNYQLVADELLRLHGFRRARSSIEAFVKANFPELVPAAPRKPRPYRRFRRARFGELWQHDSSLHPWWPAPQKQTLLLTVDDHSGFIVAGRFVPRDTTWAHFGHFRAAFEAYGLPESIYTDALSLFGPSSAQDLCDPRSQFQRALLALGVAHRVAPSPQAKGKIERRFGTFQNRMVTLLRHAKAVDYPAAQEVLQMEITRRNNTRLATTGLIPRQVYEEAAAAGKLAMTPCPQPALLDLHLSLRAQRKVYNDNTIEFDAKTFPIAKTARKSVTVLFHPGSRLWVLETSPTDVWPTILGSFSL